MAGRNNGRNGNQEQGKVVETEQYRPRADRKNRVELRGRLGADPDIRLLGDGLYVGSFNLANNILVGPRDNREEHTNWFRVKVAGQNAKYAAQYLKKGDAVEVIGRLKQEKWPGENGETRAMVVIICTDLEQIHPRGNTNSDGMDDEVVADDDNEEMAF